MDILAFCVLKTIKADFDESEHPRDDHGKFAGISKEVSVQENGRWTYFKVGNGMGGMETTLTEDGHDLQVREARVRSEERGKGYRVALYEKAIEYAHAKG